MVHARPFLRRLDRGLDPRASTAPALDLPDRACAARTRAATTFTLHASEQQRPDVVAARALWANDAELGELEQLLFFDEGGVNLS